jgi:hypothetical protein
MLGEGGLCQLRVTRGGTYTFPSSSPAEDRVSNLSGLDSRTLVMSSNASYSE